MISDVFSEVFDLILWAFDFQAAIWVALGGVFALFMAVFVMYSIWRLVFSRASGGFGASSDNMKNFFNRGDS